MAQDRLRASSGGAGSEMVYRLAFEGSTANESTGTVVPTMWIDGDPVYSTDAKVGASSFKTTGGCPAIIATDAAPLATTNTGYAITFWFKDDGAQAWSDFMGFRIGKGNYGFERAGSGVMQLYDANLDSTGQGGGLGALVPAYSFAPSAWHHIAVVVPRNSNGTVNIYLDGGNKRTVYIPTYGNSGALNDFGAGQLTEVLVGGRRAKRAEGADPRTYLMGSPWLIDDLAIFTGDFTDGDVVRMAASPEQNVPVAYNTLADDLIWLPIGDSITEGEQYMGHEDQGDINTRGGYRYQMWRQLEAGGQGVRSVGFRTGHMGTVEDAATCKWARHSAQYGGVIAHDNNGSHGAAGLNVENTLEVAGFPDIITAMIGVNDLSFTGQNTTEVVDQYRWVFATCERMVRKYALQRPNTRFFLSTLFPAGGNRGYITGYNKLMRQKAADKESPFDLPNVELVDVNELGFGGTFVASDFKSDNLHPNEMGAMKAASGFNSRIWSYIDELAASTALPVAIDNASVGTVRVLFSKKLAASATATLTIRDADGAQHVFSGPTVDGRSLVFAIGGATLASGPAAATLSNVSGEDGNGVALASGYGCADCGTVIDIQGSGAEKNVPAAFRTGFVKYQTIDIGNGESYKTGISLGDKYAGNGPTAATGLVQEDVAMSGVSRVGYYMELKRPNRPAQFVWASMDAGAFGGMLGRIGVPTVAVGNIKANVSNLQVYSNRPTVTSTAVTEGVVDTTQKGVVEFSPYDWTGTDQAGFIADFNGGKTGWNDTLGSSTLKGCMQIARVNEGYQAGSATDNYSKIAGEMVFAYNNFNKADSPSDIGIGSFSSHRADTSSNSATPTLDWTDFVSQTEFTDFAVDAYEIKKLEIWYVPGEVSPQVTTVYNRTTLPSERIDTAYRFEGAGGVLGTLRLGANGRLVYDPTKTPIRLDDVPEFESGAKLSLYGYENVSCGKVVLMTYAGGTIASATLAGLVDADSLGGAIDSVEEVVAPDGTNRQLVLKWGGYDANAVEVKIMPLGDSITDGSAKNGEWEANPNYRIPLMQKLAARGWKPVSLGIRECAFDTRLGTDSAGVTAPDEYRWHSGISGQRLRSNSSRAGLRESVDTILECSGNPDIVTLKIGTNDYGTDRTYMFDAFTNVVWRILDARPNVKVVCASILNRSGDSVQVPEYNALIQAQIAKGAGELGAFPANRVFFCDLNSACPRNEGGAYTGYYCDSSDLHPNWVGHDKTSDAWLAAVETALAAPQAGVFTPNTKLGAAANIPSEYREGFTHIYTLAPVQKAYYAKDSAVPYTYKNSLAALKTGYGKVAYYVELKGKKSGNVRFVWADMDSFDANGAIANMGVPTGYTKWGEVRNLHVYSNDAGISRIAPDEDGVSGWMQFTRGGAGSADQAGGPAEIMGGCYGSNDTPNDGGNYGIMQLHRVFDNPGADKCAAETLFAFSRWGNNLDNGSEYNEVGIGNFANHCAYAGGNATTAATTSDYIYTFNFDSVNESAYDVVSIEIWAKEDPDAQPEISGMQLVFAEEFNGDELDNRFWTPEHGLVRNADARQMYLDDQSVLSVSNGALNITVSYAPGTQNPFYDSSSSDWRKNTATQDYKSAAIDSWGKLAFRYGHAEVRARYSVATGAWPALWLVGQDLSRVDSYGDLNVPENHHRALAQDSWPMVGEIDLQEYATKAQWSEKVNSTLHYGDSWEGAKYKMYGEQYDDPTLNVPSIDDAEWHVYTLDVDETSITIGYDGQTVLTKPHSELQNPDTGKHPFRDNHFYFIFNYALGSMSEEPPADGAGYPLKLEIDYVRLYQDPTKDNGLFFGNSALRHHVTSSYAGGVYAYREGDSMPLVYSTGNAVANTLTIEVLAELAKGESGAICGWLEGSHSVQLVYNAETDRFDITYDGSTSHAKTVSYAPQDVTKPHVYTVAITARSTGVKVYQDGVLIVDAPNIYWSGDQYKITDKLTIGSAADLTQLSPGMKLYAVDWYFPTVSADCERVFSTYGMTGSAAALGTGMKAMLASLAGGATSTTLPSVTVNGVVLPAAESVETLYAIGAPITSDKSLDFALTGMDPFAGNLTSRLSESLVKGSLTVFGSATLKDCWARVAAFPGATASDSDVLPVGDAIERGYRFFKSAIESGTPDTAGYENMMIANLPSKDFTVNYKKSGEQFRIPSLCRGGDTVVALYDMRPYADDLGVSQSTGSYSPIDIAGNVSSDGGRTWSESQILIDVPNCYDYVKGIVNNQTGHPDGDYDIGDVCTLFDEDTRTFFTMGITGGGLSARNSGDLLSSWDTALYTRGEAASAPFENRRSVRDELLEKLAAKGVDTSFSGNNGILAGPGHGIQTKVRNAGRLVFPMQYFGPDGTRVFAAYSDDHGATWKVTNLAPSGYNSQENSIAEMDDGSWYMIAKKGGGHDKNGRYLLRTVDFENWNFLGEFTPSSSVQGSLLKLGQRASDGKGVYAMAFCTTGGPGTNIAQARHDLKMYFGVDAGESIEWNAADCVDVWEGPTGAKGYNSMTMVDADTVGILFEANGHIYFRQVDVHDRLR